jgi:large subunit ribosomal protein L13
MIIIDAKNMILGRVATYAAKSALLGEDVAILNCEKAVITGRKDTLIRTYKRFKDRGTHKGPFLPKLPNLFVRRAVRGMLPYKKGKGKKAFEKIKCYNGIPDDFKGKKFTAIKNADVSKVPNLFYITVGEICREIGAKFG